MTTRILAPLGAASVTANGRSYPVTNRIGDLADADAAVVCSNGGRRLMLIGSASQRPALGADQGGTLFADQTIGAVIVFDGQAWRSVATGAVV